jgi:hypothetical protein
MSPARLDGYSRGKYRLEELSDRNQNKLEDFCELYVRGIVWKYSCNRDKLKRLPCFFLWKAPVQVFDILLSRRHGG